MVNSITKIGVGKVIWYYKNGLWHSRIFAFFHKGDIRKLTHFNWLVMVIGLRVNI